MIDEHSSRFNPRKTLPEPQAGIELATFQLPEMYAENIELPTLRWWANVQVWHVYNLSGRHDMLIMLLMRYMMEMWKLENILKDGWTFVKLKPQKKISESQTRIELTTFWWPMRLSRIFLSSKIPHFQHNYIASTTLQLLLFTTRKYTIINANF